MFGVHKAIPGGGMQTQWYLVLHGETHKAHWVKDNPERNPHHMINKNKIYE